MFIYKICLTSSFNVASVCLLYIIMDNLTKQTNTLSFFHKNFVSSLNPDRENYFSVILGLT